MAKQPDNTALRNTNINFISNLLILIFLVEEFKNIKSTTGVKKSTSVLKFFVIIVAPSVINILVAILVKSIRKLGGSFTTGNY